MLHRLILSTVSEPIHEIVDYLLAILIGIDQSIGVVGTCCRERGGGATRTRVDTLASEVGIEHGHGLLLIAHVDHTQGGGRVEAVPVGRLGCPGQVVSYKGIVCGVSIHDTVGPQGRAMEN
jgi:hypothetical protein